MFKLNQTISIKSSLAKSINLDRDRTANELLSSYIITATALQNISNIAQACNQANSNKAWSLIGSYGSGKSSFALYLSHLLNHPKAKFSQLAMDKLQAANPDFKQTISNHLQGSNGYCSVLITGYPESFIKSFLKALKASIIDYYAPLKFNDDKNCAHIDSLLSANEIKLSTVMALVINIQNTIKKSGGKGLLIVIDELGKFLEYAARHESDDIFLLQTLAEATYKNNILLFVLLHQSFAQYGKNLSNKLKNEWTKIQGRYEVLSFIETTTQSLHIMGQVFSNNIKPKAFEPIKNKIKKITKILKDNLLLPISLEREFASELFINCYPLHPITSLLLPILCQKIAQNERTLFNYLGSNEPLALVEKIKHLAIGEFIMPNDIFDYFLTGQILSNDFQTQRTIFEVNTAIEHITDETLAQVNLVKTIGLLNIAGAPCASKTLLMLCDKFFVQNINKLTKKSIVNYRKFNNEYRIWQGSDFDLNAALDNQVAQLSVFNIANDLNDSAIFLPFVAKRYSIEKHSLFYFEPFFINISEYKDKEKETNNPRIIFCLSDDREDKKIFKDGLIRHFSNQDICVFLNNSKEIKQASRHRIALENIHKQNAVIQQDPVIQREFKLYLANAKRTELSLLNQIINKPHQYLWYQDKILKSIENKRQIQKLLSDTLDRIYCHTPIIKNELINRNNPSAQANAGRKKLLLALLENYDKEDLAIELYPAEKSMYRAILKDSGIHQEKDGKWQIQPPINKKYLKVWQRIEDFFNTTQQQAKDFSELNEALIAPPFGIKKPILPIFYMAVYLFNKDEMAVYEDRFYVPYFTAEHLERFLKRQNNFTFQQFKIEGIKQSFIQEYEKSLLDGKKAPNAPALFRAMEVFMKDIPLFTKQTNSICETAIKVRDAFKNNKSPQDLLFKKLPEACGFSHQNADGFGEKLKQALQDIKNAYPKMLNGQIGILAEKLEIQRLEKNKGKIKTKLVEYGQTLEAYTIDQETTKFINALSSSYGDINNYFERVLLSVNDKLPKNWTDSDNDFVKQKLSEHIKLIINLDKIHKHHTEDRLIDPQEIAIMANAQKLSEEGKLRLVNQILKSITIKANNKTHKSL